jgi:hypothetical protein
MASIEAKAEFITTLRVHYSVTIYEPNREEKEKAWTKSIADCIDPYSDDIVRRGMAKILHTRTSDRRFPLPAEIRKVCDQIVVDDRQAQGMMDTSQFNRSYSNNRSAERIRLADDLVMGALGKEAARDGWISALHQFVCREMRLPNQGEIGRVKRAAADFDEGYEIAVRGGWPLANAMADLGDTMLANRERLRKMVLGEDA